MYDEHGQKLLTTAEAAERLGLRRVSILQYLRRGTLHAEHKVGRDYLLAVGEIERYRNERRPPGFPHLQQKIGNPPADAQAPAGDATQAEVLATELALPTDESSTSPSQPLDPS